MGNGCAATKLGQYVDAENAEPVSTFSTDAFAHVIPTICLVLWC